MMCRTHWPDCPNAARTLEIIQGVGVPVMRCKLTGRHPDECATRDRDAVRSMETEGLQSLRTGKPGAAGNRPTSGHTQSRNSK